MLGLVRERSKNKCPLPRNSHLSGQTPVHVAKEGIQTKQNKTKIKQQKKDGIQASPRPKLSFESPLGFQGGGRPGVGGGAGP